MLAGPPIWILYTLAAVIVSAFISFLISPFVAWRKGYAPYYWMFACGPIGLLVILCLPGLKSTAHPEAYERLENRVNVTGGILTGIQVFLGFIAIMATFVAF